MSTVENNAETCQYLALVGPHRVCRHELDRNDAGAHVIPSPAVCDSCVIRTWACNAMRPIPTEAEIEAVLNTRKRPSRGLGDTIADITTALGIKPCGGCKERQKKLNEWLPYRQPPAPSLPDVTFGITAFERPAHLKRLVASILAVYPGAQIVVADNGRQRANLPSSVKLLELPYDCGLSAARNVLIDQLTTRYLLVLEEDFIFTALTRIEAFIEVLNHHPEVGCVGGTLDHGGNLQDYAVDLYSRRGILFGVKSGGPALVTDEGTPYRLCDKIYNFGLWRREMLADHRWPDELKLVEHTSYFWHVKRAGKWLVAQTPAVVAKHDQTGRSQVYLQHRNRVAENFTRWYAADGIGFFRQETRMSNNAPPALLPNVVILGVGHSGTTILSRMLGASGWKLGDADQTFAESVSVRAVNKAWLANGSFDRRLAAAALKRLPQPFVLKDPRFVLSLDKWLQELAKLGSSLSLVWLTRNAADLEGSYRKRGEWTDGKPNLHYMGGRTLAELHAAAQRQFELWPWAKMKVDYAQVAAGAALFLPKATKSLRVGVDLDGTLYAHPQIFKSLVESLSAAGHKVYLITWHSIEGWQRVHRAKVQALGIDPALLDASLLHSDRDAKRWKSKYQWKASVADQLDLVFDDEWQHIQPLTKTPIFAPGAAA